MLAVHSGSRTMSTHNLVTTSDTMNSDVNFDIRGMTPPGGSHLQDVSKGVDVLAARRVCVQAVSG